MYFECINCNTSVDAHISISLCTHCGYPLTIRHNGDPEMQTNNEAVTLGEGHSKMITLAKVANSLGVSKIYAKLENSNPTGSFKDRGSSAMLSAIKSAGISSIVEDSSGNAGASIAAYAALAGITAHIFVPENAPKAKVDQILVYGANVHKIPGHRDNAEIQAKNFASEQKLLYASHNINPYFLEGTKSFAREVVTEFEPNLPDHIIIPVGNGSLLISTYLVIKECWVSGNISKIPKLYAVQSESIKPIVSRLHNIGWSFNPEQNTCADGIASLNPPRMKQIVNSIIKTKGDSIGVSEESIQKHHRLVAENEGIYMEPTSAVSFAGLEALVNNKTIDSGDSVLIPITGSGLKSST